VRRTLATVSVVALLVGGCEPGEREARPFVGRWQSQGFGLLLDVHGGTVDVYEHTAVHCIRVASGATRGISEAVSIEQGLLVLRDAGRVVEFASIESLPARCSDPVNPDPGVVFAVAVESVREHYLPEPDSEWLASAAEIGATLLANSTPAELHAALVLALTALDDPEVRLAVGDPGLPPAWSIEDGGISRLLASHPEAHPMAAGGLFTRDLGPGLGYLGVSLLAAPDEDAQRTFATAIDSVLAGATDGLVVDLRGSSGGLEEGALLLATRFVPTERVVAHRLARSGDELVEAGQLTITPRPTGAYGGPVVVLIGPSTSGAAELLAWILADLPGVTLIGAPTAGSARDPLVRALPNGWSLGVPNADVRGPGGDTRLGLPLVPDIDAPTTLDDLSSGRDPGLSAALETLGGG
jgi:hypothetical protein